MPKTIKRRAPASSKPRSSSRSTKVSAGKTSQKITPYLWFNNNAEEAMNLYVSIFKNSKILSVNRYGDAGPGPTGSVMMGTFQLAGQKFHALNGGPHFKFNPSVSFFVDCETQADVDYFWDKFLSSGGKASQCGWLEDKFGLSWQIIPRALLKLVSDKNTKKAQAAMKAMLGMQKIDVAGLQAAFDNA